HDCDLIAPWHKKKLTLAPPYVYGDSPMSADEHDDDLVFGKNAVLAFLSTSQGNEPRQAGAGAGQVSKVYLAEGMRPGGRIEEIKRLAKQAGVPLTVVERRRLDRLVGPEDRHQGVVAQISQVAMRTLEEFLPDLLKGRSSLLELEPDAKPV